MSLRRTFAACAHEALVVALSTAIAIAPFGCQLQGLPFLGNDPNDSAGGEKPTTGLFVNPDVNDPLLIAARNAAGDEFFVYGKRGSNGGIDPAKIESILVKLANGKQSVLAFQNGRPVYFEAPDGTNVKITYTEIETNLFNVSVEVFLATTGETSTYTGQIDLRQIATNLEAAARNAAAAIKQATGVDIAVPNMDDFPTEKTHDRSLGVALSLLFTIPMVALCYGTIVIFSELVALSVAAAIDSATQAVEIAVEPLFDFASIFQETAFQVEIIPLFDLFIVPAPPIFIFD